MLVNVRKDENSASRTYGMYFGEVEYAYSSSSRFVSLRRFVRGMVLNSKELESSIPPPRR